MRHLYPILVLLIIGLSLQAQKALIGLEYQMSYNENWGANRPVILTVYPGSPADLADLHAGDIIETINGKETHLMEEEDIVKLLQGSPGRSVDLIVSNFAYHRTKRQLRTVAMPTNALSEQDIAKAFAMYSLEDESDILISYPISTGTEGNIDLINYRTFGFARGNKTYSNRDAQIEAQVKAALETKGLSYSAREPDLLIDIYYSIRENIDYNASTAKRNTRLTSLRIDSKQHKLVELPLMPIGTNKILAHYYLKFGITIYSGVNEHKMLWTSEAEELLSDNYSLTDYTDLTVPVMLLQFPFTRYFNSPIVRFATHRHLSLGINYQSNDITTIYSTLHNSPAAQAGLQAGDRIIAINSRSLGNADELSNSYKAFVKKSVPYRNKEQFFAIKNGPTNCRYWAPEDYTKVAKLLNKEKYLGGFSYLFSFNPWITTTPSTTITLDYVRDGVMQRTEVAPQLQESCYITLE